MPVHPTLAKMLAEWKLGGWAQMSNHDARRTMISIARAGGASKDLLEWVTHGPPGDVIDGYTTLPWETLCTQVLCIKVERRQGKVLALPMAAGARIEPAIGDGRSQVLSQVRG